VDNAVAQEIGFFWFAAGGLAIQYLPSQRQALEPIRGSIAAAFKHAARRLHREGCRGGICARHGAGTAQTERQQP
jgi:hypothetical protein